MLVSQSVSLGKKLHIWRVMAGMQAGRDCLTYVIRSVLKFSCKHTRTGIRIINLYLDQFVISDYKKGKVENPSHTVVFLVKRKSLRNLPRV